MQIPYVNDKQKGRDGTRILFGNDNRSDDNKSDDNRFRFGG